MANNNKNNSIVTANIRPILNGIFSDRCKTLVAIATFERSNIRDKNVLDNSMLTALMVERDALFAYDDLTLAKMFKIVIHKKIVGVNLTQIGVKNLLAIGDFIKPMHFDKYRFTKVDIDNYYNTLANVKPLANYGEKSEYFIGDKRTITNERDRTYKQDVLYRGIVGDKEIKRYCQVKFFDDLSSTANIDIDFEKIFGMTKNEYLEKY